MCIVAIPWVSDTWWMLLLLRDLVCGDCEPTLNGSCMLHLRVYTSVRNDLGLGFLSTYLVAVAGPFPFVCGAPFLRYLRYCHVQARSFFGRRATHSAFAGGRVFRGCGGDLLPEGIGLDVCSLGGSFWVCCNLEPRKASAVPADAVVG